MASLIWHYLGQFITEALQVGRHFSYLCKFNLHRAMWNANCRIVLWQTCFLQSSWVFWMDLQALFWFWFGFYLPCKRACWWRDVTCTISSRLPIQIVHKCYWSDAMLFDYELRKASLLLRIEFEIAVFVFLNIFIGVGWFLGFEDMSRKLESLLLKEFLKKYYLII